jgi:hypothetical protein
MLASSYTVAATFAIPFGASFRLARLTVVDERKHENADGRHRHDDDQDKEGCQS